MPDVTVRGLEMKDCSNCLRIRPSVRLSVVFLSKLISLSTHFISMPDSGVWENIVQLQTAVYDACFMTLPEYMGKRSERLIYLSADREMTACAVIVSTSALLAPQIQRI